MISVGAVKASDGNIWTENEVKNEITLHYSERANRSVIYRSEEADV